MKFAASNRLVLLAAPAIFCACHESLFSALEDDTTVSRDPVVTGSLVVSNVTTGGAFDPDGFLVSVDGRPAVALELNKAITLPNILPGSHTAELSGIASNCALIGEARLGSTVEIGATARVEFEVVCTPPTGLAGIRVMFTRYAERSSTIVAVNADGSGRKELTDGSSRDSDADLSPDGRTIAFTRDVIDDRHRPDIYLMNADGSGAHAIAIGPLYNPRWSPDGNRLLFVVGTGHWGGSLYVSRADGTEARPLLDSGDEHEDAWPAWSPDATRVAFTRAEVFTGTFTSVWITNANGTGPQRLTESRLGGASWPVWSADGRLAFSEADGYLKTSRIRAMNADGSAIVTLLESEKDHIMAHDWSADGRWLLFTKKGDLHLLNVGDRSIVRITADGASAMPVFAPNVGP